MKRELLMGLVSLVMIGCGGSDSGADLNISENNTSIPINGIYENTDSEQMKYIKVINYARSIGRECKDGNKTEGDFVATHALVYSQELYDAALEHNLDMIATNTFTHEGSGTSSDTTGDNISTGHKSTYIERIKANGYGFYTIIGENLAAGPTTIEGAVEKWLKSPGHCANLMNNEFTQMGLARNEDASTTYGVYWTHEFGKPR